MATLEQMKKDNHKRIPLKFDEFATLRCMFGTLYILVHAKEAMTERLSYIPNGKRDMAMIVSQFTKLLQNITYTTPAEKLNALKSEMDNTHIEIKTTKPKLSRMQGGVTYVNNQALSRLINRAMEMECFGCRKCGKEAKACPLYKDIQAIYHYDFPDVNNTCPLAYARVEEVYNDDAGTEAG